MVPMTLVFMAVASVVTVLWAFGAWSALVPAEGLGALPPGAAAATLAAVAAPPAVLWLALAVAAAGASARRTDRAMRALLHHTRRATEQAEVHGRTLLQMQEETRRARQRDGFEEALADLRSSLALIAERTGLLTAEDTEIAWARTAAGDRWAFAHAFLTPWAYQPDLPEILGERIAEAPEAAAALQAYLRRWRALLRVLSDSEADPLLRETLEDGPGDRVHAFLLRAEKTAVALLSDTRGGSGGGRDGAGPVPEQDREAAAAAQPFADLPPPPPAAAVAREAPLVGRLRRPAASGGSGFGAVAAGAGGAGG